MIQRLTTLSFSLHQWPALFCWHTMRGLVCASICRIASQLICQNAGKRGQLWRTALHCTLSLTNLMIFLLFIISRILATLLSSQSSSNWNVHSFQGQSDWDDDDHSWLGCDIENKCETEKEQNSCTICSTGYHQYRLTFLSVGVHHSLCSLHVLQLMTNSVC